MALRRRRRTDASEHGAFAPGWEVPAHFNFTRDVVDAFAQDSTRAALAFVDLEGIVDRVSFAELSADAARWAHLLRTRLDRGERVVVMLGKTPAWHGAMLGALKGGLVAVPCPDMLRAADLAFRVRHSGARLVLAERKDETEVEEMRNQVGGDVVVLYLDEAKRELSRYLPVAPTEDTRASESALILYTSGTTKEPRGVVHTHGYTWAQRMQAGQWLDVTDSDVVWCTASTGWAKAVWNVLLGPWSYGAEIVLHEAPFDAEERLGLLEKLGVTILCQAPTEYRFLAKSEALATAYLPKLRHAVSAGEPLNPEVIARFEETLGLTIHDGYGQTENSLLVANLPGAEIRPGSMGLPTPGHDVAVIDDAGHVCPPGVEGDIALIGRPPTLFTGYWEAPEDTNGAFRDGWYLTGDRATRDDDGYLWFVGRADDVILSAAYRIGPFEVESALLEHPAVKESAAVGVPDEDRGQIVKAFVVLSEGHEPAAALVSELQEHVKAVTAPYKYPRVIAFVDELPKTTSGKIRRAELRADPHVGVVPRESDEAPALQDALALPYDRRAEREAEAVVREIPDDGGREALEAARRAEAEEARRRAAEAVEAERARAAAAKAEAEAEERARADADAQARRDAVEQARLEAEQHSRLEGEAQSARAAEEARARAEAEEQAAREAEEARARAEAEEQAAREAEEARARAEAEEQAAREAEEARARAEAEEQAAREAEEARARAEAEEQAAREAEEQSRRQAEEAERARAEAEAEAAERARAEAEAAERARAEAEEAERARAAAEAAERARSEAEAAERARAEAEAEAEERERVEAEEAERARAAAEEGARREAEEAAARQALAEAARREAEETARRADEEAERERLDVAAAAALAPVELVERETSGDGDADSGGDEHPGWREERRRRREEAAREKAAAEEAKRAEKEAAEARKHAEVEARAEAKRQEAQAKADAKRHEADAKQRAKDEAEQRKRDEAEARRNAETSAKRRAREEAEQRKLDAIAAKETARRREAEAKEAAQRQAEDERRRRDEERTLARERTEEDRRRAKDLARLRRGGRGRIFGRDEDVPTPLEQDGVEETIPDLVDRLSRYSNSRVPEPEPDDGAVAANDPLDAERPQQR